MAGFDRIHRARTMGLRRVKQADLELSIESMPLSDLMVRASALRDDSVEAHGPLLLRAVSGWHTASTGPSTTFVTRRFVSYATIFIGLSLISINYEANASASISTRV